MSVQSRSLQRENELLARELGYDEGHPRYQWEHSDRLTLPMVILDDDSQIVMDYHCRCGVNQSVHSADCTFTIPRPRWEIRNLVPRLHNQYVLVRWLKPEASRDDWEATFGGVPYPSGGYLFPVGDPEKTIHLKPGRIPSRATTELVIHSIKEHFSRSAKQRSDDLREKWDKNEKQFQAKLKDACVDAFPVHTGFPGWKEEWSAGGDPTVESPTLRKKMAAPEVVI